RIGARVVVVADTLLQTVQKGRWRDASNQRRIAATVEPIGLAAHAGYIAQRILDGQRTLITNAVAGDHADRLWCLDDRRVGLCGADAARGDIAIHRSIASLNRSRRRDLLRLE